MYLQHYNLQQLPFRNTPDPRFFYETPRHNEALANLVYAVEQRRGFVLLSGEIGSGKTLVTHLLLEHLEDHAQIALIRNTHLNSSQLIRLVCDEFSVQVHAQADKAAMLLSLNQFLIQQLAEDRLVVIIIDEAQNLSDKVLEELRMLSNLETSSDKLLQIVLVGQPELRDKVSQPHLEQLRQRIALSYHLEPLTLEEIAQYIQHRLKIAAGDGSANVEFTPEAVAKIARFSRGTPRIINGLCDNALLYGFTAQTHTIDEPLIDKVLKHSMHLVPKQHTPTRSPLNAFGGGAGRPTSRRSTPVEPPNPPETPDPDELGGTGTSGILRPSAREGGPRNTPLTQRSQPAPAPVANAAQSEDPGLKKAEGGTISVPPIIPFPGRQTAHGPAAAQQ
jgi:general secretion pathway protein A